MQCTRVTGPGKEKTARFWRSTAVMAGVAIAHLAALAFFFPEVRAQQDVAALSGEPRYTVEMIVFQYREADSSGNEIFVPDKPKLLPDAEEELPADVAQNTFSDLPGEIPGQAQAHGSAADTARAKDQHPTRQRIELQLLGPEESTMDEIYRKLERLDAYEPIMRAAWTQTTPPKDASPAVHLRALGDPPRGLHGSVTIYRGRYLHMVVDLALDANADGERQNMTATDRLIAYGDGRTRDYEGSAQLDAVLKQPVRFRIFEDRIMKTGDIRYFDHPRFGVVARVTRPDEEPAAAGDAGSVSSATD